MDNEIPPYNILINGDVCFLVMDLRGREIIKENLECSADCEKNIDIKGLNAGAYFVRVTSVNNIPMIRKLIVK